MTNGQILGCVETKGAGEPLEKEVILQDLPDRHLNPQTLADQRAEVRNVPDVVDVHLLLHQDLRGHVQDRGQGHLHQKVFPAETTRTVQKVLSTEILLRFRKG